MFHLEECVDQCAKETKCLAVNYETGLCVLFSASADFNPGKFIRLRKRICNELMLLQFHANL